MGEYDALRCSFRSRGEKHDACRFVGRVQPKEPRDERPGYSGNLVSYCEFIADIFKIDDFSKFRELLHEILKACDLDEFVGREDFRDFCRGTGRADIVNTCGKVQHGGNAGIGLQGEKSHHGARPSWQEDANAFTAQCAPFDCVTETK